MHILEGVKPVKDQEWSREAASTFNELVEGRDVWAFVCGVREKGDTIYQLVDLVDTQTKEDKVLSDKLTALGHAEPVFNM